MKRKSYQKAKRQTIFQNIAFAFLAMAIFSCSQTGSQFHNTVILPEERISQAIPLEMEDIWYPVDSIYPKNFYVYADSILIVENKKGAGHFLDFYNIPSKSLVASQIPYGEGPNEWLFTQMYFEGNYMHITDYIKSRFCKLDIHQVVTDATYTPQLIDYPREIIMTCPPNLLGDSIIGVNSFYYVNHLMKVDQQPPHLFFITGNPDNYPKIEDYEYMTVNVSQGLMGVNPRLKKAFFASFDASDIEFYNSRLQLTQKVSGPVQLPEADLKLLTDKENGFRELVYNARTGRPEAYINYTMLNDTIYFTYTGAYRKWDDTKKYPSYILKIDWEGHLLQTYKTPVEISTISASWDKSDTFYGTIKDEEGNPKPVKLVPKD